MSSHADRIAAPQVVRRHDTLACQQSARLAVLLLDLGVSTGGALPMLTPVERLALLFALAECYEQLPPPGRGAASL
jgi:hypothetical protein